MEEKIIELIKKYQDDEKKYRVGAMKNPSPSASAYYEERANFLLKIIEDLTVILQQTSR